MNLYNEEAALQLANEIIKTYINEFEQFRKGTLDLYEDVLPDIC